VADDAIVFVNKSEIKSADGKVVMTEAISSAMVLVESVDEAGNIVETLGDESKSMVELLK